MAECVKHTGGSVSGKTRKPYDAMVYKDADSGYTIAVDANGNVIKKVLSSANTDDVAFQAAFDYMNSKAESTLNGCKLQIGTGTYNLANGFTITYPHTIVGNGPSQTILKAAANMTMFNIVPVGPTWEFCRITMRDLALHGNSVASYGITFGPVDQVNLNIVFSVFENMVVRNFKTWGVVNNCNWGSTYRSVFFKDNGDESGNPQDTGGLKITGSSGDGHVNCIFCGFDWNATAISVGGSSDTSNNKFYGCVIEGNTYHGIYITGISSVVVRDCWFEWNAGYNGSNPPINLYDIYGDGTSTRVLVDNCKFSGWNVTKCIQSTGNVLLSNNFTTNIETPQSPTYLSAPAIIRSITPSINTPVFDSEFLDADNWTTTGWTGNFNDGFTHTTGNTNALTHDHVPTVNEYYNISLIVTGRTAGTYTISFGGESFPYSIAEGTTFGIKASSASPVLITPTSDFNGTIKISINRVIGASLPILSIRSSTDSPMVEIRTKQTLTLTYGVGAGQYAHAGLQNTFIGNYSGSRNMGGYHNTFIGYATGTNSVYNFGNTCVGANAFYNNIKGHNNVAIGSAALLSSVSASNNVCIGCECGYYITSSYNTVIGSFAGRSLQAAYNNTFVGYYAGYNANQLSTVANSIGIGRDVFTTRNGQAVFGSTSITETQLRANVYVGETSTTSYTQPTAKIHIAAGSATAGTAPLKLTAGTNLTTPEAGAIEFDGSDFYVTIGSTRYRLVRAVDRKVGTNATVTAGNTYIDVTHNLSSTPTSVRVTPTSNLGGRSFWVSDKGSSTFRINIDSTDTINHTFDWEAEV